MSVLLVGAAVVAGIGVDGEQTWRFGWWAAGGVDVVVVIIGVDVGVAVGLDGIVVVDIVGVVLGVGVVVELLWSAG